MKPTDLRIGCYVKLRDSGEIVRVERLSRRKCGFFHGNDKSRSYFRKYSEIKPVKIFEVKSSLPYIPNFFWNDKAMREDLYYYKDLPITDLHELQNIHYALTGNEIEIEL
ncbi:hypothetical protein [Clavibacter sp.]|uniref:hypothetical protein n=1 Tax=Clavibacter sp. TaxID=1871044 RepID=UPI0019CD7B00|nr:hypothetical protein [Clavibacter sp.]MBD5381981.1 hypothetical protein [Clavibacter sp.]